MRHKDQRLKYWTALKSRCRWELIVPVKLHGVTFVMVQMN